MLILINTNVLDMALDFYRRGTFPVADGFSKNVIIFGADMSSPVHVDNKEIF